MSNQPVDRHAYDEDWIASAWTDAANEALLARGDLTPRPRVARAMELLRLQPGLHLLDIACGRGEVPALATRMGAYATGIDYSDASVGFAAKLRKVLGAEHASKLALVQGDACNLPFADASFDRVSMLDIVEHLVPAQLESMFREVSRILKPDGFAVVHTLPNRWVYDGGYRVARTLWRRLPKDPRSDSEKRIHINEQDVVRLHRMLARVGLSHRIWLEQHIPAQARWRADQTVYNDQRGDVYPLMARWPGRLLEMFSKTPLRLVLANDIFAVLWKKGNAPAAAGRIPLAWTERATCALAGGAVN